jgi:hypothetical protein
LRPLFSRHIDAVLTEMAHAAVRTKTSYFKSRYHRLAGRRGKKRAIGGSSTACWSPSILCFAITSPIKPSSFRAAVAQLDAVAGIGERGGRALLAETGTDMSRETVKNFWRSTNQVFQALVMWRD